MGEAYSRAQECRDEHRIGAAGGGRRRRGKRAPDTRGPHLAAARDADDAWTRGARDAPVPAGEGARLVLRRLRPGGGISRRGVRDGPCGPALHPAPGPRRTHHPRRHAGADPRPVPRAQHRAHSRTRWQRALRRPGARLRRHGLDAARHDAGGHRHGDGVQAARRTALRAHLVRRRLDLARRFPRGDELGGGAATAGRIHPREQPVCVFDPAGEAVRGRPGEARGRLRVRRRQGRRQRCRGDVRGHAGGARPGAGRRRADADRSGDDADAWPRRARRHEVCAARAGGVLANPRSDRAPGGPLARAGRRRRHAAGAGRRRDRGSHSASARGVDAGSRHGDRRRLLRDRGRAARRRRAALVRIPGEWRAGRCRWRRPRNGRGRPADPRQIAGADPQIAGADPQISGADREVVS